MPEPFIALEGNRALITSERAEYAKLQALSDYKHRQELASATPGGFGADDFVQIRTAEARRIDLAIHKDSFLDDVAVRGSVPIGVKRAWTTRYTPVLGVTVGGLYGSGPSHLYQVQDNAQYLQPYSYDIDAVEVPAVSMLQDAAKLGEREAGLARQQEAHKLRQQDYLASLMTGQPYGTDLATCFYNYATQTANPYNGYTVYVVDPGVQTGTYDTSNIVNMSSEGGITQNVLFGLMNQMILSDRRIRTIHVPKRGTPWRELIKQATIVANANVFGPGQRTNPNMNSIPQGMQDQLWKISQLSALDPAGMEIDIFGYKFVIKANNALPKGVAVVTTEEPACLWYDVTGEGVSYDYDEVNPHNRAFVKSYSKRTVMGGVPDPWRRNWFALVFDTPSL